MLSTLREPLSPFLRRVILEELVSHGRLTTFQIQANCGYTMAPEIAMRGYRQGLKRKNHNQESVPDQIWTGQNKQVVRMLCVMNARGYILRVAGVAKSHSCKNSSVWEITRLGRDWLASNNGSA